MGEALAAFAAANAIEIGNDPDGDKLYGLHCIQWADMIRRLGDRRRAHDLIRVNREICSRNALYQNVAHCDCLLGRLAAEDGQFDVAAAHLEKAEAPFRRGGAVRNLLNVLLANADLGLRRGDWEGGLAAAEEALRLAAQRGFRLVQADGLVLRGRLILSQAASEAEATLRQAAFRASDDGEAALTLARDCGYAWAERDAWALLAETRGLTGDTSGAALARREADTLTRRLSDTTPPDPDPFAWVYEALQARRRERRGRAGQ
jgi:tetratricopeptide (TPR) repeat protein